MKNQIWVIIIAMIAATYVVFPLFTVNAHPDAMTKVSVQPSECYAWKKGEVFQVNVTLETDESEHLVGLNFRLKYDGTLLKVLDVVEGPFLKQFEQSATEPYTFFIYYLEDEYYGSHIVIGTLIFPNGTGQWPGPFPNGNGTIATITFQAIYHQPVEPLNCILELFDAMVINDEGDYLEYDLVNGYYEIAPLAYTYEPLRPTAGQEIVFDVSERVEASWVTWYYWQFDDGTTLNTTSPTVTHVLNASGSYNVALTVKYTDNTTLTIAKTVEVGAYAHFEVRIDAASLYFGGEICEYNILTTYLGRAVNFKELSAILYFEGDVYANLTGSVEAVETGFYRIPYTIPGTAEAGTYTLLVEAKHDGMNGINMKSFYISDNLAGIKDTVDSIHNDILTLVIPDLGVIKLNLTEINATVTSINGTTVTISTNIGNLTSDISDLDDSILSLDGEIGGLDTKVDEVKGTQGTILTTLYATLILAIIGIAAAAYFAIKIRK